MRVKAGYDSVNLSKIDDDTVIEESSVLKRSRLGVFRIFARRVFFDVRMALKNRKDLDIRVYQVPYFLVMSPIIRGIELTAAVTTIFRPTYFNKKYDW